MDEKFILTKQIVSISGDTISELKFDFDKLKPSDYPQINKLEARLKGNGFNISDVSSWSKSTSSEFRIATAWIAAIKGTQGLVLDDIESISFRDLIELEKIGIFFMVGMA